MSTIIQVTAWGEEHGLLKRTANSVQGDGFSHMTPTAKADAEKKKKEDAKIVKAKYLHKGRGKEGLRKPYCRYAGEPIQHWQFFHNHIYDVPKGLIDEINSVKTISREGKCDANGDNPLARDQLDDPVHSFVPVGF